MTREMGCVLGPGEGTTALTDQVNRAREWASAAHTLIFIFALLESPGALHLRARLSFSSCHVLGWDTRNRTKHAPHALCRHPLNMAHWCGQWFSQSNRRHKQTSFARGLMYCRAVDSVNAACSCTYLDESKTG